MKTIDILIKPASERCNLNCDYCFYHDIANNRTVKDFGIMTKETSEQLIGQAFADPQLQTVNFGFQGGEPLVAGYEYFVNFLDLVAVYNQRNIKVNYSLQTNGTLLTAEFCQLFKAANFLIGISIDGPGNIHDSYRRDYKGKQSHHQVTVGLNLIKQYQLDYNVLLVVTNNTAKQVERIYKYYQKLEITHLQFIPCIDPIGVSNGKVKWALTPRNYTIFLNELFKLWLDDLKQKKAFSIQYFDNLYGVLNGYQPPSCFLRGICTLQNIVEADGSVYICDFYVNENYQIGNVKTDSFPQMASNPRISQFINRSQEVNAKCKDCPFWTMCRNGCFRYRDPLSQRNIYCSSFYDFFQKNQRGILELKYL